jgi:HlyD family secretion protein
LDELIRGPREEQIIAARANVAGAIRDLEFRAIEYERALKVHELKLASPKSLDSAKAAVDSAKATLEFYEARLKELLTGTTIEELRQSESRVKQAEAILSSLNIDLDRHEIIAPVDGVVDVILFEVGERPNIGVPTVVMLAGTQPYVRAYIPETVRALLRTGDSATIYIDGIEEVFIGRIRWISAEAAFTPYFTLTQKDRGRLTFFSKIDVLSEDKRLVDGVPVEVEFKTENHDL